MSSLTNKTERMILDWIFGKNPDPFQYPLEVRLMYSNGDGNTKGVELTNGNSGANKYTPQTIKFKPSETISGAAVSKLKEQIEFTKLSTTDDIDVAGFEIWDNSASPLRVAWVAFDTPVTVLTNSNAKFTTDSITISLD